MLDRQQIVAQLMIMLPEVLPDITLVNVGKSFARGSHHRHYSVEATGSDGSTRQLVVRIPFANDQRTCKRMIVEHLLLQFLHQQECDWVPNSLYCDCTENMLAMPFAVQSHVAGVRPRWISKRQTNQLAQMMGLLHSLAMPLSLSTLLPSYRIWEDVARALLKEQRRWFHNVMAANPPEELMGLLPIVERVLQRVADTIEDGRLYLQGTVSRQYIVHGDIGLHNLLQSDEEEHLGLLDWEFATSGDPAFDVAVFFQNGHLKKPRRTIFLSTYQLLCEEKGESLEGFWERVALYEPMVSIQTALWALGELFGAWPQASSLSQVAWYCRCLHRRLSSIDAPTGEQASVLLTELLRQRLAGGAET